jgi:hypothetical protein
VKVAPKATTPAPVKVVTPAPVVKTVVKPVVVHTPGVKVVVPTTLAPLPPLHVSGWGWFAPKHFKIVVPLWNGGWVTIRV